MDPLGRFPESPTGLPSFVPVEGSRFAHDNSAAATLRDSLEIGLGAVREILSALSKSFDRNRGSGHPAAEAAHVAACRPASQTRSPYGRVFLASEICLVSIEPVSDFILMDVYCQGRDAKSWTTPLTTALEGLPVAVVPVTSDEATGLLAHAREGLGAHHRPDLFHVPHNVSQATRLPLRAQTNPAQAALDDARQQTQRAIERRDADLRSRRRPGRPPDVGAASRRAAPSGRRGWPGGKPLQSDRSRCTRRSAAWGTIPIPSTSPAVTLLTRMLSGSALPRVHRGKAGPCVARFADGP